MHRSLKAGIVFAVLIGAWSLLGQLYYQGPKNYGYYASRHESHNVFETEKTDDRIARYTLWLAIFTGALTFSTWLLWRATRHSVRIAERALTELEGPFLSVNITNPGIHWGPARKITIANLQFCIVNYGRTVASVLELSDIFISRPIKDGLPPALDPNKQRGALMPYGVIAPPNGGPTQTFTTVIPGRFDFFEGGTGGIAAPRVQAAWFRGFLRYRDIFENKYVMGFCFLFDPERNRWVLRGGEAHNYCRKEGQSPLRPEWLQPSADPHDVRSDLGRAWLKVETKK